MKETDKQNQHQGREHPAAGRAGVVQGAHQGAAVPVPGCAHPRRERRRDRAQGRRGRLHPGYAR